MTTFNKQFIIEQVSCYSEHYSKRLADCEDLFNNGFNYAALVLLLILLENVSASMIENYNLSAYETFKELKTRELITSEEHEYISGKGNSSLRKVRNTLAHRNLGRYQIVITENNTSTSYNLSENTTFQKLYALISYSVFNLICKIVLAPYGSEFENADGIDLSEEFRKYTFIIKKATSEELLEAKGYPKEYFPDFLDTPECQKIRIINNWPSKRTDQ